MPEKNRRVEYLRLLDEEIAACMREFSELKVKRVSKTALSSHAAGGKDVDDEEESISDREIDGYLRTEEEIRALQEEDASVNEEYVEGEREVKESRGRKQQREDKMDLEFLIVEDIESHGYVRSGEIVKRDKSIVRAYIKDFKDVRSEIYLLLKERNYPRIDWTTRTKNMSHGGPARLSIEHVVDAMKFHIVNSSDKWNQLKKQCIYNFAESDEKIKHDEAFFKEVKKLCEEENSALSQAIEECARQFIEEERAQKRIKGRAWK